MIFILPTFKYVKGLQSFLKIKKKNNKVIIADNSEGYEIFNLVKSNSDIQYFRNYPSGPIENWNRALQNTPSDHILILHDDEYLDEATYDELMRIKKNPQEIYLLLYEVHQDSKRVNFTFPKIIQKFLLNYLPKMTLFMNFIGPTAAYAFYHDSNKPIYYDQNLKWLVDLDFFYRIAEKKKFNFLPLKVHTKLKDTSLTQKFYKNNFKIYIKEIWYLKKKYNISLISFVFYLNLTFILRLIKKIIVLSIK